MPIEPISLSIAVGLGVLGAWLEREKIRDEFRDFWPKGNIFILGPKGVGKTSLIAYLKGVPIPKFHIETGLNDKRGKVVKEVAAEKLRSGVIIDVGGDPTAEWAKNRMAIFGELKPHGVIVMLDTESVEKERFAINELANIYATYKADKPKKASNLRTVLLLINKADEWVDGSSVSGESMIKKYRDEFKNEIEKLEKFSLEVQVGWGSLLVTDLYGKQTEDTLARFARSINGKG